jgi:hypothetical protein
MAQPSLFEAERLKQDGMARADANADDRWRLTTDSIIRVLAARKPVFTTDDVHEALATTGATTHDNRAIGARMQSAARQGLIEITDRVQKSERPACHRRPVAIWRSLVYVKR